ncbi:stabilin-2-like [Electrophorus electricus]|uniref:stabilin-2-like n=1 Tax=Electrophorus electricus TaxID=8005 RepID=UPI0015CF9EC5|nr:stabilin-2-like [Electrophorus electricus]
MLTEGQNMTLFVPSEQAIGNLNKDDRDYWLAVSNLPSLVKSHMVSGFFALAELRSSPSPELVSLLKKTLPVSWTNETTRVAGAKIVSGDIVAKNGFIHLIDTASVKKTLKNAVESSYCYVVEMIDWCFFARFSSLIVRFT